MIRFIHTADIHFGMENYGKIDPETGIHSRLLDFERALNFCIDSAILYDVDLFVFAGDAYKTAHPSQTQQKLLVRCFMRLYAAKIPTVIVVGNHDHPLSFGKAHALNIFDELPFDGFYIIDKPTTLSLKTKSGMVQVVGIPWPTRNTITIANKHLTYDPSEITEYISRAVTHIIQDAASKLDPTIPAILTGHLTVSNGIFSGSEKRAIYGTDPLFLPSQLAIHPFDYVALGHLHRYQNLNPNGYPAVVYSGSIERVDFGERKEDKGFCLVTIAEKGQTTHQFIEGPMRPFIQIEVHLKPGQPQTETVLAALAKYDITDAVIKILYYLPEGKLDAVDARVIQTACEKAMHLVGVFPVHSTQTRSRRSGTFKAEDDLTTLLTNYFDSKPELKDRTSELLAKTLELAQEVAHEEHI